MHAYSGGWRSKHTVDTAFSKLHDSFCEEWNLQETQSAEKIRHLKIQKCQHQKATEEKYFAILELFNFKWQDTEETWRNISESKMTGSNF